MTTEIFLDKSCVKILLESNKYRLSLLNFLDKQKMLKKKYKEIADDKRAYDCHLQSLWLYVPIKMLSELPLILSALDCKQIARCFRDRGSTSTKLVKERVKNYYCGDFFRRLVSIFGNEKACEEFDVSKQWKPNLSFIKRTYDCCPLILSPHFNFAQYKLVNHYGVRGRIPFWFGVIVRWTNEKPLCIKQYNPTSTLSKVSKQTISKALNKPNEKVAKNIQKAVSILENNKKLLSEDGVELLKDLSLVRTLL